MFPKDMFIMIVMTIIIVIYQFYFLTQDHMWRPGASLLDPV